MAYLDAFIKFAKNDCQLRRVCPSVHPPARSVHKTGLSLDGFSWNLVLHDFSKIS